MRGVKLLYCRDCTIALPPCVLGLGQLGLRPGLRLRLRLRLRLFGARRWRFGLTTPRPRHKTQVRPVRLLLAGECSLALVLVEIDFAPPVVEIYPIFLFKFTPLARG